MKMPKTVPAAILFSVFVIICYYFYSLFCVSLIAKYQTRYEVIENLDIASPYQSFALEQPSSSRAAV